MRKILRQDRQSYGHKTSKVSIDDFHFQREGEKGMNPRICICCGQPMAVGGNALSRNPNICASCSSILDGMNDLEPNEFERPVENLPEKPEPALAERL